MTQQHSESATQPVVWSIPEAAALLEVNEKTLYVLVRHNPIPGVAKIGRQWRILRDPFLEAWAKGDIRMEILTSNPSA